MAGDTLQAQYDQLEQISALFQQQSEKSNAIYRQLAQQLETLKPGWISDAATAFYQDFDTDVLPATDRLAKALNQSSLVTRQIVSLLQSAEDECANMLPRDGFGGPMIGGAGMAFAGGGAAGGYSGGYAGGASGNYKIRDADIGNYPDRRWINQTDVLHAYLGGGLTSEEAHRMMRFAEKDMVWRNMIDAKGVLYDQTLVDAGGSLAHFDLLSGDNYGVDVDFAGYDANADAKLTVGPDGTFEAKLSGDARFYAAQIQGSVESNGFFAAGDAYVGAEVYGDVGAELNLFEGDANFQGEVGAFIGAKAEGSIGYENEFFTIAAEGAVSYGAGAEGKAIIGLDDGVFVADMGILASAGVGGGAGLKFRLDIPKTADYLVDVGEAGVDMFIDGANDYFDMIF